jgi:hypothetical protein
MIQKSQLVIVSLQRGGKHYAKHHCLSRMNRLWLLALVLVTVLPSPGAKSQCLNESASVNKTTQLWMSICPSPYIDGLLTQGIARPNLQVHCMFPKTASYSSETVKFPSAFCASLVGG